MVMFYRNGKLYSTRLALLPSAKKKKNKSGCMQIFRQVIEPVVSSNNSPLGKHCLKKRFIKFVLLIKD